MFVTAQENAQLYELLGQYADDPVAATQYALECIVQRRNEDTPYGQLAEVIFASIAASGIGAVTEDEISLRYAAGRMLALGRYRKAEYEEMLKEQGTQGTVLETIKMRPMLTYDIDRYDLETDVEGMEDEEIGMISLYFESMGEFALAAKAVRLAGELKMAQMYAFLEGMQKRFMFPAVVN